MEIIYGLCFIAGIWCLAKLIRAIYTKGVTFSVISMFTGSLLYDIAYYVFYLVYYTLYFIGMILAFICLLLAPLFWPGLIIGLVLFGIYIILEIVWDDGARPIMSIIIQGLNFVIGLWNSLVKALRSFGIRFPMCPNFGQELPTLWGFIKGILYMIFDLIKAMLKGTIIR